MNFDIPIDIKYSNRLVYLQLITVLAYGNISSKNHEQTLVYL